MINAVWKEDIEKVFVDLKTDSEHFQQEYVAVITAVIKVLRDSGYKDDTIEYMLCEAINDGFENLKNTVQLM